jgi:carboxyl-terminal processing protease
MPPSDAQKFTEDISGEFSGIGAEIGIRDGQLVVVSPMKDSPAERAGLKPMDKILMVDSENTDGFTTDDAVKIIRGEKGTAVVLTIFRDSWAEPKKISIIRDTIIIPTMEWEMRGNIAYVRLYNFYEKAPYLFYQMAIDFSQYNPRGMVLDLRNDPGGYLNVAINLAGWFMDGGKVVVVEEFGNGEKQEYTSYGNGYFKNIPVVVLVNGGSASASEILAGALRDIRGSKLVGEKTFGKGTVQEVEQLSDGSLAKITVAHWRLPGGLIIEKNGLEPDYEVKITEEDMLAGRDPQLEKAIEVLGGQIENEKPFPLDRLLNVEVIEIE